MKLKAKINFNKRAKKKNQKSKIKRIRTEMKNKTYKKL